VEARRSVEEPVVVRHRTARSCSHKRQPLACARDGEYLLLAGSVRTGGGRRSGPEQLGTDVHRRAAVEVGEVGVGAGIEELP
jgi:hypothetical protein